MRGFFYGVAGPLLFLVLWEAVVRFFGVPVYVLPAPSAILMRTIADLPSLLDGLSQFGVVGIDGSTPSDRRADAEVQFRENPKARVFLAQIVAAGEAIDLSAADEMICVETSTVPKDMKQVALRITNNQKARLCRVRVASLAGSVDEPLQEILLRKWSSIRKVLQ